MMLGGPRWKLMLRGLYGTWCWGASMVRKLRGPRLKFWWGTTCGNLYWGPRRYHTSNCCWKPCMNHAQIAVANGTLGDPDNNVCWGIPIKCVRGTTLQEMLVGTPIKFTVGDPDCRWSLVKLRWWISHKGWVLG